MNGKEFTPRQATLAFWLLIGMVVWFAHEMVWDNRVPFYRDLGPYFYPMRFSLAQSFAAGELPLWDRSMAMGFPLLANFQSGVFYPPHLFLLVLPFFSAMRAIFFLHYLVAAIGSYKLCRHWNYPPYLAVLGGILFTLGGTNVSLINVLNHFQTAVWLPWAVLFWERALRSWSGKDFLGLSLVLLVQFLAGSPEIYMMSMGLLLCDGLRLRKEEAALTYRRGLLLLAAANFLVVGLAMVQILPTMELFFESRGGKPILFVESAMWSLHPLDLINLFFLDKEVNTSLGSGVRLFFLRDIPFLVSYYMGAISLFGIALYLFYGPRKEKSLVAGITVFSLILAAGGYTPLYPTLFRYLPLFSLFRYPEKFFFFTYALLIFMTLKGLSDFLESESPLSRRHLIIFSFIFFLVFFPYLVFRLNMGTLSGYIAQALHIPLLSIDTLGRTSAVIVNLERQIVLTLGVFLLLYLGKKGQLRHSLFQTLIVGLVFIDLNSAHQSYQYLINPDFVYKKPKVIRSPDPEPNRLFYYPGPSYLHPNYYTILRQPSFPEVYPLVYANLLPNTGLFYGFDYMQELDALRRWPYLVFLNAANKLPPDKLYRLLGALNVRYVVSFRELGGSGISLVGHFPEHPSWLYRLDYFVPRAYIVDRAREEKDPAKVVEQLSNGKFNPLKEVILEQPLPMTARKKLPAQAKIIHYANQNVIVHASLSGSGVLVLADSYYPGWRVYVDGKEQEILRANFFFRGVTLSEGKHLVEFRYQPRSFILGLIISLIMLCGVVLGVIVFSLPKRKKINGEKP